MLDPNDPRIMHQPARLIHGITARTSNADEQDPEAAQIVKLWNRCMDEGVVARIPDVREPEILYGVYHDYESDEYGDYTLLVGAESREGIQPPEGLSAAAIPEGEYLVFQNEGDLTTAVEETWAVIWEYFMADVPYARAFGVDFEQYPAPNRVDICISVKPREAE